MKFAIETHAIRDAINKIFSVIDKKNSRPILTNCLILAKDESIEISATDLEVSAKVIINCSIQEKGKFCINTKNFFDILRELPNDVIEFNVEKNSNLLKLDCKSISYSLLIANADDFPSAQFQGHKENTFSITSEQMLEIISKTSYAISTDETRLFLNGIYLQSLDKKLRAVAIDGHRLALFDVSDFDISENSQLQKGVIIPRKGISELKKLAESNANSKIQISLDDAFIFFNGDDKYFLSVRLISRDYPNYQTVIPNKTTRSFKVARNQFLDAVKRIKLLSNEKTNGIKISLSENRIVISSNHPSLGHASESFDVDYNSEPIDIGFNARYLVETLSVLEDPEIFFEFNNELNPVVVKSKELTSFLGIIMPLKL